MPQVGHAPLVLLCTAGHMVHPHSPDSGAAESAAGRVASPGAPEGIPDGPVAVPVDGSDGPQPVTIARTIRVVAHLMKFTDPGFRD
jgi:hypothetical protein